MEMREKDLIFDIVSPPAVMQVKETDRGIRGYSKEENKGSVVCKEWGTLVLHSLLTVQLAD